MRFTKEVNIYAPDAILKRFKANETNFSVLQGKISSLISESEITELINGSITMYSKASKAQTVTFSFNKVSESIALTTTWKKFSFIKDITSIATSGSLIIFGGSNSISTGDGTIYIYRPDVRHGYSSEDIFNLLTNNGNIQGIQENPKGQGWASGKNYGQKIINILNGILSIKTSKTEKESNTMNINTSLISNNNSYAGQKPAYIVIHNTDNYAKGANAKAHAKAQHDGNFKGYSAHVYVDDTEAYQALPYNRGAWHVGVNYGGRLFGTVNNRNSVGIEMCVQAGYNYEKAFQNTVQVCKQLMKQLGIPADRVVQHYDVCAKNCPSAIRAKGDWNRFKQLIGAETTTPTVDKYYRTRKSWADSKSQIGAYKSLENAKKEWKQGYTIYDWNGKAVYPVQTSGKAVVLTGKFETQLPIIRKGNSGVAVSMLQSVLGVTVDGNFGDDTETSLKVFQKNTGVKANGTCGIDSWKRVIEHMKTNTK